MNVIYWTGPALVFFACAGAGAADLDIPRDLSKGIEAEKILEENREQGRNLAPVQGREVSGARAEIPSGVRVRLKNGGSLEGLLLSDDGRRIMIEFGAGTITLNKEDVASLELSRNRFQEFKEREARVAPTDAKALWELALWAKANNLSSYADKTAQRLIALEPDHAGARALLGFEQVEGRWMKKSEAMRAKGFVWHKGQWITKSEYELILKAEEEKRLRREEERRLKEEERRRQEEERQERRREQIEEARRRAEASRRFRYNGGGTYWYGSPYYPYPYPGYPYQCPPRRIIIIPPYCQPQPPCQPQRPCQPWRVHPGCGSSNGTGGLGHHSGCSPHR